MRRLLVFLLALDLVMLGAGFLSSLPGARATSTVSFATTADWDRGNKGTTNAPLPGSIVQVANVPTGAADMPSVQYGGLIYLFGGYGSSSANILSNTQRYNPSTNTWAAMATMTTARWGACAALWADRAYVFAGAVSGGGTGTNKTEFYNISTNTWGSGAAVPSYLAQQGCEAATVGGTIYVFYSKGVERYYPGNNTWLNLTFSSLSLSWSGLGVIGTDVFLIGGGPFGGAGVSTVRVYHTVSNTWNDAYDIAPYAAYGGLRDNAVANGKIYYAYGFTGSANNFFGLIYSYDPLLLKWTQYTSSIYPRDGLAGQIVDGVLYTFGGRDISSGGTASGTQYAEKITFSQATDGNYLVDTATDNPSVSANSIALASQGGDNFTVADSDATTFKWTSGLGVGGTASCAGPVSVTGGRVYVNISQAYSTDICVKGVRSANPVTAPIDVQVKVASLTVTTNDVIRFQVITSPTVNFAQGGINGVLYKIVRGSFSWLATASTIASGTATDRNLNLNLSTLTGPFCLRLNNTGAGGTGIWTWRYSLSSTCASWSTQFSYSYSFSNTVYPGLVFTMAPIAGSHSVYFDDYQVRTGTVAYRTSGSWSSSGQSGQSENATSITLDYTGVSAARTISRVSILSASGSELWYNSTPVTSGTTIRYSVPGTPLNNGWTVRVNLSGDGAGSPVVTRLTVGIGTVAVTTSTLDVNAWIFVFLIVALLAMLALSWWFDNLLFFLPAGAITMLLAFQAWNVTADFAPTFAIVAVAIVELAVPIGYITNRRVSRT